MTKAILVFCLLNLLMVSPILCSLGDVLGGAVRVGEKSVSAVATPVEKTVVSVTLKNCEPFKAIFGATYKQLSGSNEPDISKLTLDFWTGPDKKVVYSLSSAASELLKNPEFDRRKPVKVFLHGFLSSSESDAPIEVSKKFIEKGESNVLALDSSSLIQFFYLKSSTCVVFVGRALGNALVELAKGGVDPKNIHIIGHSLGSHIAGYAGKTFNDEMGLKVGRITGLDPAGPCFFRKVPEHRLQETDAEFVDVIHSDAGVFGIVDSIGHVDFYPNRGEAQPGCLIPPCSHTRAWELFAESINDPESFPAVKCSGWDTFKSGGCDNALKNFMGLGADKSKTGIFYLKTDNRFPFGLGRRGVAGKSKGFLGLF